MESLNLANLPSILAGPIVRRVTFERAAVWVALKQPAHLTLTVYTVESKPKVVAKGEAKTIRLGEHLHLALVDAVVTGGSLSPNTEYRYEVTAGDTDFRTLLGEGFRSLCYPGMEGPSFVTPPEKLEDARIFHGSCRKPHGKGKDAMPLIDDAIAEAIAAKKQRPQQLFLTGDQIYADDVADPLLRILLDRMKTLLGWDEALPPGVDKEDTNFEPGKRGEMVEDLAGLTANKVASKSHLVRFGEYALMYMLAWSDLLWPASLPDFAELYPREAAERERSIARNRNLKVRNKPQIAHAELVNSIAAEAQALDSYRDRDGLRKVRRLLANTATYMIFDDHEITDDWFLNQGWCEDVLSKPLGRRILMNGMWAYALFQGWGNKPEDFAPGKPGDALLHGIADVYERPATDQHKPALAAALRALNLPTEETAKAFVAKLKEEHKIPQFKDSLDWNYQVVSPCYEVIVLDTRTQRQYHVGGLLNRDEPAGLMADYALAVGEGGQIPPKPQIDKPDWVTIVVSPAPVVGFEAAEDFQEFLGKVTGDYYFDQEAWGFQQKAFQSLFATLAGRSKSARVVFLSGDIHYGYVADMHFWALKMYRQGSDGEVVEGTAQFVQCVSSGFKNEVGPAGWIYEKEEKFRTLVDRRDLFAGWENPRNDGIRVGTDNRDSPFGGLRHEGWMATGSPAVVEVPFDDSKQLTKSPEWGYEIRLLATASSIPVDVHAGKPTEAKRLLMFPSNVGELQLGAGVSHVLHWHGGGGKLFGYVVPWRLELPPPELRIVAKPVVG